MNPIATYSELLEMMAQYDNPKALNSYVNNAWQSISSQELTQQVKYVALGLIELGIKKGDCIGIMALPSSHWSIVDLAIIATGAISVPLFANISEENFRYEIALTSMKTVFVSGDEPWERYKNDKHLFKTAISLEDFDIGKGNKSYQELLELGKTKDHRDPEFYKKMLDQRKREDISTIVFTSGSTGIPKGVEHTHYSLTSLLHDDLFQWDRHNDRYLSILPLAHITGRCLNLIMLSWGVSLYYFNDIKNFSTACKEIHPTLMTVVPRLLEKVYTKMVTAVDGAGLLKRAIGHWAFDLANQEKETIWKHLFQPLAEKLVYSNLREALGGSLRVIICGGAPLDPHLCHFYRDIGFPIYEGWGMTEGCPFTVNVAGKTKIGTVGPPIPGVTIKIGENDELLVKGSNLMRGYFKDTKAGETGIDKTGWLHTGDKGEIDGEGFVTIIGRLKELLKTSNGKMIAPVPIEHILCKAPFIEMAVVIAEHKRFTSCLLVPDFEVLKALKTKHHLNGESDLEFLKSEYIKNEMEKLLLRVNEHLNHWEQIQDYRFIPKPLTVEKGELTPSMKIVRSTIEQNYKDLIDSIYAEGSK